MEEFPKTGPEAHDGAEDKELKESRKKGPKGFFLSYLRAFYPDRLKTDKTNKEDDDEAEKKSVWGRMTERFKLPWKRKFGDTVIVEPVASSAEKSTDPEKSSKTSSRLSETPTVQIDTPTELSQPLKEANIDTATETSTVTQEAATKIDHTSETTSTSDELLETSLAELPSDEPIAAEQIHKAEADAQASGGAQPERIAQVDTAPQHSVPEAVISYDEHARKREEIRLRHEVNRLERTAKDLRAEQEAVKRQQEKFTHNLEKQYKAYEKLHKETLPKLRQSRERLRSRLEPAVKVSEVNSQIHTATKTLEAKPIYKQPTDERLMELAKVSPVVQPEVILHTVEHAAEQNIAIESAYERRHELKDEPVTPAIAIGSGGPGIASISHQQAVGASIDLRELSNTTHQVTEQLKTQPSQIMPHPLSKELYTQAVKGGFWAAIILLVLLGILMLTR